MGINHHKRNVPRAANRNFSCWINFASPVHFVRLGTVGLITVLGLIFTEAGGVEDRGALPTANTVRRESIV